MLSCHYLRGVPSCHNPIVWNQAGNRIFSRVLPLTMPLHRTDWINKLIWKEVFFFLLIAGTRRTGLKILALFSLGMQRWGFGGIYPARQHFLAESVPRIAEDVCGISKHDPLTESTNTRWSQGNPLRTRLAWHPPDHCSQEPRSVDDGWYCLIHEWVCLNEVQGVIRKLIGGCISF